jgi:diadenosine tetraphosphate (Ap4A) HIT family hydrolase
VASDPGPVSAEPLLPGGSWPEEEPRAELHRLWAGWKLGTYGTGLGADGQPHANLPRGDGLSLFETIERSGLSDDVTYVVWRGVNTFVILNVFPYTSGHVMVLPTVARPSIHDLDDVVHDELWRTVRLASRAIQDAFRPQGMNIGINEGMAGGGSEPDHLHVHVVPRWTADTNFMTATGSTRVLPQTLRDTWANLVAAWPVD